jgi:hypothetical protein
MFLNATMLAGIAGAVLPLVLHLLSRARYRRVRWGAMMFLADQHAQQSAGPRVKELSLLLLRMGIVGLLAVALARPVLAPRAGAAAPDEPACIVVIVDRSGSMGLEDNGQQRFYPARRAVLNILAALRRGDEAALVYTPEWLPQHPPLLTSDLRTLAASASEMRPAVARADMAAALGPAARLLNSSRASEKQLIIVCDRQASSWRGVDPELAAMWRDSVRDPQTGRLPKVSLIPIGSIEAGNVAIESVTPVNPPFVRDIPAEIEVRITNYDSVPRTALPLRLSLGGVEIYSTTVNLDAGQTLDYRCPVKFTSIGSRIVRAQIGVSDIGNDDFLECAVEVTAPISVLIISGDERPQGTKGMRGEADYLRLALAPFATSGQTGPDPARIDVISSSDEWPQLDRMRHRVVVLANVPRPTAMQVRQVEQYVYSGGGLLVAPGNLCDVEQYDAQLWRDGSAVLPAELDEPVTGKASQVTSVLGLELAHPIFEFLQQRSDPVPDIRVSGYFPAAAGESSRVLGRYGSGKPFLVEGTFGRGRVLLFTTPLDADWSTLPLSSFYLPMVQSAVRYLAAGTYSQRNLLPGEPLMAMIDDATELRAELHGPGDPVHNIDLVPVGPAREARFSRTLRPGAYWLDYQSGPDRRQLYFVVRGQRDESDVRALNAEQWAHLRQMFDLDVLEFDQPQAAAAALAGTHRRRELWPVLLCAVIALALVEMGLAYVWTAPQGARP